MRCLSNQHFYTSVRTVLVLSICTPIAFAQTIHVPTVGNTPSATVRNSQPKQGENPQHEPGPQPEAQPNVTSTAKAVICGICLPTVGKDSATIQQFFGVNAPVSPLTQVGSVYNGASGSATVSADLVSLIMPGGWLAKVTTNIQAGSSGETNVTQGTIPTLSASAAGQATQNMLYGGTIQLAADFPLIFYGHNLTSAGGTGWEVDVVSREGIDVQNFKSGTSTSVSSPPSHHSTQLETFFFVNSLNLPSAGTSGFAGSLFIGGSYGYSYTSHGYARDYGFGKRVNNDIGQVTAGIMITNVSKISVSRAFGPSQTYIDSTSMTQTRINNFKAWSFAITYQSASTPKTN